MAAKRPLHHGDNDDDDGDDDADGRGQTVASLPCSADRPGSGGAAGGHLSAEEFALYDRQIRLWGIKGQLRLRNANVLLINVGSLGNELAKNLVLAGIGYLTVVDPHDVVDSDPDAQFLVSREDIGQSRARVAGEHLKLLNQRVKITILQTALQDCDGSFYEQFDIVLATDLDFHLSTRVNKHCHERFIPFYLATVNGFFGWAFADLINQKEKGITASPKRSSLGYEYDTLAEALERPFGKGKKPNVLRKASSLISLIKALWTWDEMHPGIKPSEKFFDQFKPLTLEVAEKQSLSKSLCTDMMVELFIRNINMEFSPVASIVGGFVAQDIINFIGKQGKGLCNFFVFDGTSAEGKIYRL